MTKTRKKWALRAGKTLALAGLAGSMALLAACESLMTPGQSRSLYADVYETRRAVSDMKTDQSESLRRLTDLVVELDKKINEQDRFLRESKDDLQRQIKETQDQIKAVRPASAFAAAPAPTPVPDAGIPPIAAVPSQEEMQQFNAAKADVDAKNQDAAIEKLNAFLNTYPNSTKAPDAVYLLGQAHYEKARFDEAIKAFERIPTQYPAATGVIPLALHAQSLAELKLQQNAKARATLERLKQTYPDYEPAKIDQLLRQIPNP